MNVYYKKAEIQQCCLYAGLQRYPKLLSELEQEFMRVVPPELTTRDEVRARRVADHIRAFYFQQRPVDLHNIDSLIDVSNSFYRQIKSSFYIFGSSWQNLWQNSWQN